jgi:hypothetical protein
MAVGFSSGASTRSRRQQPANFSAGPSTRIYFPMQKVEMQIIINIHATIRNGAFSGDTLETQTALVPCFLVGGNPGHTSRSGKGINQEFSGIGLPVRRQTSE